MKKILKIILYSLLSLVALVVVAIVVLPRIIDPNDYKPELITQVKKITGRDLEIPGNISLSVFPWLGLDIGKASLSNPAGFKDKQFVQLEHAKAQVRLLSLFKDELEIGQLELLGLQIHLQKNADGKNNWSDLIEHQTAQHEKPATPPATPTKTGKRIRIDSIAINQAAIELDDRQSQQHVSLTNIDVKAGPFRQQQMPLQLAVNFAMQEPAITGLVQLQTELTADLDKQHLVLSDLRMQLDAQGKLLPENPLHVTLQVPTLSLDVPKQEVEIKTFSLALGKLQSRGQFSLAHFDRPQVRFAVDIDELALDRYLVKSTAAAPTAAAKSAAPATVPALPATLDIQGTLRIAQISYHGIQAEKIEVPVTLKDGRGRLQPTLHLYQGDYLGDWQINTQTPSPRWQMQHQLRHLTLGPLVQAISGKDVVRGQAELDANVTSQGINPDEMLQHLNGTARVHIAKAELLNLDLRDWLAQKYYEQIQKVRGTTTVNDVTLLDEVQASATITNGVITNKDFLAKAERQHLTGAGTIDLVNQSIDYTFNYIPKTDYVFSFLSQEYNLKDEPFPITVRGKWSDLPKPKPDVAEVIKRFANRALEKKKTEVKQKVEKKIEEKKQDIKQNFEEKLKKFLNR